MGFQFKCTSGSSCPYEGAIATCGFSYNQGPGDWRLIPGAWEFHTEGADRLPRGWTCTIQPPPPAESNAEIFDASYYLAIHPDLQAAFGGNLQAATDHWLTYGINEGRRGSAWFSARTYLDRYADVRAVYGESNYRGAMEHYVQYGKRESRSGN
jgi:hypothetical protein